MRDHSKKAKNNKTNSFGSLKKIKGAYFGSYYRSKRNFRKSSCNFFSEYSEIFYCNSKIPREFRKSLLLYFMYFKLLEMALGNYKFENEGSSF